MGLDDIAGKAGSFLNNDKVKSALHGEQAEGVSDKVLDGASDAAKKVSGDKFGDQIDGARQAADKQVGNE